MSADSAAATSDELPAVLPVVHSHSAAAGTEISTCLHTYPGAKRHMEGRGSPTARWMYGQGSESVPLNWTDANSLELKGIADIWTERGALSFHKPIKDTH